MALDREILEEIKAYMDTRNDALKAQQARHIMRAIREVEKRRNESLKGWIQTILMVSGASLFVLFGGLYITVTKQATSIAKEQAAEASQQFLNESKDLKARIAEIENHQSTVLDNIVNSSEVLGEARGTLKELEALSREAKTLVTDNEGEFQKIKDIGQDIDNFATAAAGNKAFVEAILTKVAFPKGIVLASTITCDALLPKGNWSDFEPAIGRMIVGAGDKEGSPYKAGLLSDRRAWNSVMGDTPPEYTVGGAEEVTLTEAQISAHRHPLPMHLTGQGDDTGVPGFAHTGRAYANRIFVSGGGLGHQTLSNDPSGEPHPNMPPYIALYFCKKD